MKFVWEEKDIRAGLEYGRKGIGERWMIGYQPLGEPERRFNTVSLSDGLITAPLTAAEMATMLTLGRYIPVDFADLK